MESGKSSNSKAAQDLDLPRSATLLVVLAKRPAVRSWMPA
jgi:hypothetical protein